jgi:predicted DNA-binding transcriptional regulator AlpA
MTHNACMDANQTKIIDLLREVHLLAFKEIERLNLRIAELQSESRQSAVKSMTIEHPSIHSSPIKRDTLRTVPETLNEKQVADYLNMSTAILHKWRRLQMGPKFLRIGRLVRYRRSDLERWLDSCSGQS